MTTPAVEIINQIERPGKPAGEQEARSLFVGGRAWRLEQRRLMAAERQGQRVRESELALSFSEGAGAFEGAQPGQVGVLLQGGLVQVRKPVQAQPEWLQGVTRGQIKEETRASRRRQLKSLLRLDAKAGWYFLCVTYHLTWPDPRGLQRDLLALCKRIERAWPGHSVRWRRDVQDRGAWHFHMLTTAPIQQAQLLRMWQEVTGDSTITQVDVESANTNVRLLRYLTKYLGKEVVAKACASGAAAVTIGGGNPEGVPADRAAAEGEEAALEEGSGEHSITGAYLPAGGFVGRSWGCRGRTYTPWAQPKEYALPVGYWFVMLRRLARGSWKASQRGWTEARKANRHAREAWEGMVRRQVGGFSVFVSSVDDWERALAWCLVEGQGRTASGGRRLGFNGELGGA